jgi:Ca2+-binding RTX toxin-like protein
MKDVIATRKGSTMHIAVTDGKASKLYGTEENDLIVGHRSNDCLYGLGGDDYLNGGLGNDKLYGGEGNDRLDGYVGADQLSGGAGSDIFVVGCWSDSRDQSNQRDTILDFAAEDFIELCGVTMDQIEIEMIGAGEYRVCVHSVAGDSRWDIGIDVIGVAPTEANFILGS